MKKNYNVLLSLLFIIGFNSLQLNGQSWQWAQSMGGLNNDAARVICTDPSGNVIVAGGYFGSAMNIGTVSINNAGGGDIFIAKFNPQGNLMWVQTIGGTGLEIIGGVCTGTNGNVYLTGQFTSPVLSVAGSTLANAGTSTSDIFVTCYSSLGSHLWTNRYGSSGAESTGGIAYSSSLNAIIINGSYSSNTFNIGAFTLTNTNTNTTNDVFIARLNTLGVANWAITTGAANSNDSGVDVDVDSSGNVYSGGGFQPITGTTSFIGSSVTSNGSQDVYLAKYSSAGTFQWVRTGGSSATSADNLSNVEVNSANDVYICGSHFGAPMMIGTATLANQGAYDAFVAKYNSSGTFQWANSVNGPGSENGLCITSDGNNDVYLTGSFSSTIATAGTTTLTNSGPGQSELYVIKYTSAGAPVWLSTATGTASETGYAITSDALSNIYVGGAFNNAATATFGNNTLSSAGSNDAFLAKIGCASVFINGPSSLCAGNSATLTATGATSYTWNTGATSSSIIVTPGATTVYSLTGTSMSGSCNATPDSYTLSILPASINPGANLNLSCKQKTAIAATTTPSAPLSVTWTPNTNLSSTSVLNPTVTGANGVTVYTVNAALSNGCTAFNTLTVTTTAQVPDICLVTVDSLGVNNEIYWEKTSFPQADSFIVYRETSTNIYKRIGAVSRTAFSMYTDTNRTIGPANGDPNFTYYRYKLQTRDSCGNYSVLSLWHETLFVQDQQNGNFNWNSYAIESSPTPVANYNLKRRDLVVGTETLVLNTVGNLATDPLFNTLWNSQTKWFVDAIGFNCNPTAKLVNGNNQVFAQKFKTKSNQANDKKFPPVGVKKETYLLNNMNVYPVPAKDELTVSFKVIDQGSLILSLETILGVKVYSEPVQVLSTKIDTSELPSGIYFLNVSENDKTMLSQKIVITH